MGTECTFELRDSPELRKADNSLTYVILIFTYLLELANILFNWSIPLFYKKSAFQEIDTKPMFQTWQDLQLNEET